MREAYGEVLVELGREHEDLVVLDADLAKATRTELFGHIFPERYFDMGIAEANMICTAAGLALEGFRSIVTTFAVFMPGRNFEQIRNTICYNGLNVKMVATHAGVSVGFDGGSHQAIEDIALARVLPKMEVYSPADIHQTKAVLRYLVTRKGPAYVRLPRLDRTTIYERETPYRPETDVLRQGADVTIAATGIMVDLALQAADRLGAKGLSCRVLNVHCLKPLDEATLVAAARETRGIVTVEDHAVIGGLGSAVADCVTATAPCRLRKLGVKDAFGQSGSCDDVLRFYGLTVEKIVAAALDLATGADGGGQHARG